MEQLHPVTFFRDTDYEGISWKLDALQPWGEKPLYLAIARAMHELSNEPPTSATAIIVLTDGDNHQGLARHRVTHEQTLAALTRQLVPIHFIEVGPAPKSDDVTEKRLHEVADRSGGTVVHANGTDGMLVEQILSGSHRVTLAEKPAAAGPKASEVATEVEAARALLKPVERSILGSVTYAGRPVLSATLTLEGAGIPPVKADRQGRFLIRRVPSGRSYKLHVEAIARNKFQDKDIDVTVESADREQPFLSIDLQ